MVWVAIGILAMMGCAALAARVPAIGLPAGVLASLVLLIGPIAQGQPAAAAIAPAVLLATLAAVILGRSSPDGIRTPHHFAKWILIVLAILGVLTVAFAAPLVWAYGVLYAAAFGFCLLTAAFATRRAIADDDLATIAAAVRQNLPLHGALAAAAEGRSDKRSHVLRRISSRLATGAPLSEALRSGFRGCPGHALALITAAERTGQISAAVACLQKDVAERRNRRPADGAVHPWYPLIVLLICLIVLIGMSMLIVPRYEKILGTWKSQLPALTRGVMGVARWACAFGVVGIPLLLGAILITGAVLWIVTSVRPRRPDSPRLLSVVGDWLKWRLPGFRWFERNDSLLHTVEFLRLALEAGNTVDDAVSAARDLDVNCCFRKRLTRWRDRILRGENVAEAARKTGMGRAVAWAFDTKANPAQTPRVLASLETFYRGSHNHAAHLVRSALWPCVSLGLALLVGVIVVAMFLPLKAIIESGMGSSGP
ncbi:MAG TPA: type II secretion system F family protein [Phycisphaerae bacterium]|nr:type II secretion system F family protein [Phycisphaerae bacterium]